MTLQTADPGDRSTTPSLPGAPGDRPGSLLRQSISSSAPTCTSITWVGTRSHTIPSTRPHSPIPYSPSSTPGSSTPWKPTWPSPARSYSGARRAQHGHMSVWIGERCVITGDVLHHPIQCRHSVCTARGDADPTRPAQQGAHCLQRRPRRMRSCSAPISPAPPLAAFSPPTRATTSRRNPTTDIPPPSGLCSSSNSRPDLRRQRPVRCHHHAVGGSPIPRTGRELPKL